MIFYGINISNLLKYDKLLSNPPPYFDFNNILNIIQDYDFILSKGHGSLALYAVLNAAGTINDDWINDFCREKSKYGGHPDKQKIPGVVASTGSLGHGLPIAVGRVLANRNKLISQRSYCLVGDGELNEGSIWESLLLIERFNLFELCLIYFIF